MTVRKTSDLKRWLVQKVSLKDRLRENIENNDFKRRLG